MLPARYDDDDDDTYIIYIYTRMMELACIEDLARLTYIYIYIYNAIGRKLKAN